VNFVERLQADEAFRREQFPIANHAIFMGHASVTVLPKAAIDGINEFTDHCTREHQESAWSVARINETRALSAQLIGATAAEIALLGPTSLGLNLVAQGIDWRPGDEVVSYFDDYPSNVYPWRALESRGVKYVSLTIERPGVVTWDAVERALTPKTRLVSLASCHFLSGYRIDIDDIGRRLRERGVLFNLDGIQTLGAFPTPVEYVDFMSADAHKWLLGPGGIGVFYVRRELQDQLRPAILGGSNVVSPDYITQRDERFQDDGRRYESGALNWLGAHGMCGVLRMLLDAGPERIAARLLAIRARLIDGIRPLGYRLFLESAEGPPWAPDAAHDSAIVTVWHPTKDMAQVFARLGAANVVTSQRRTRDGRTFVRFSPHFYNSDAEVARVIDLLR
jgi:selenocysteine lyase/cysteine desulfurase